MSRKRIIRAAFLVSFFALIIVAALAAPPPQTAHACLPCYCPEDPTLNCFGDYAVFAYEQGAGCKIDIYFVAPTGGQLLMSYDAGELAAIPVEDEGVLINTANAVSLYKLGPNNYQVSWGPNVENRMFVTTFSGCPAREVRETIYTIGGETNSYQERFYSPGGPDYLAPENATGSGDIPANPIPVEPAAPVEATPEAAPPAVSADSDILADPLNLLNPDGVQAGALEDLGGSITD